MEGKLIVHFGTSFESARKKVLNPLTELIGGEDIYEEAYTSGMIRKKLGSIGLIKNNIEEAVKKLIEKGVKSINVIPTFLIDGIEYRKLTAEIVDLSEKFSFEYRLGKPLLYDERSMENLGDAIVRILKKDGVSKPILLCGHGSKSKSDDRYADLSKYISNKLNLKAFTSNMEGERKYQKAVEKLVEEEISDVYIMPLMMVYGDHGHNDIEGVEDDSLVSILKKKGIKYTLVNKGLGEYEEIRNLFVKNISQGTVTTEKIDCDEIEYIKKPMEIEDRSMEIIREELKIRDFNYDEKDFPIISRIIHTTGDPDYFKYISISQFFIDRASFMMKKGCRIYCDTNMIVSGVNKKACEKLKVTPFTYISDERIIKISKDKGITRSMAGVDLAIEEGITCFAFGNAPTGLYRLLEHVKEGRVNPDFIIGVPVGFVGAAHSKEYLSTFNINQVRINGNRGGSNIAASIINALLYENGGR